MVNRGLIMPIVAFAAAYAIAWVLPLGALPDALEDAIGAIVFIVLYVVFLLRTGLSAEERRFGAWVTEHAARFRSRSRTDRIEAPPERPV